MVAAITGEAPAKAAKGVMLPKAKVQMQPSMMVHATVRPQQSMQENEESNYLEQYVDEAIEAANPHVVRNDKVVLDPDGSPIVWPWEANLVNALPSKGVPRRASDAMIEKTMLPTGAEREKRRKPDWIASMKSVL